MNLDRLLLWLSAKGQGSWPQFRARVEEFCSDESDAFQGDSEDAERSEAETSDLPIYQEVRFALQRLGHVEFYTAGAENGWRVVPPSVAFPADMSNTGLLCGARSPAMLDTLCRASDIEVTSSAFNGMPERIALRGHSPDAIIANARALGFQVQKDAPMALLSVTPRVRDPRTWHPSPMPDTPGWSIHRFSISRRQWVGVPPSDVRNVPMGLFRFALRHQRFYYLRWRNCSYRVPVQIGKYAIMRKQHSILHYDSRRCTFSTPAVFRPPLLIERALVLCSGKLGQFDPPTGWIEYSEVPPNVANLASQLLQQQAR